MLADFRAHGYPSPLLALERLQQAAPQAPNVTPLDLRWRHESAVADLAWRAGNHPTARAAAERLQTLVDSERCAPCATALLLRQQQQAESASPAELRRRLAALAALPEPSDVQLRFEWYIGRATAESTLGDYEGAIANALKASEVATQHGRPADLVTSLGMLAVINASRRDLHRAIEYARQGVALARDIGFKYALVRLLVNHSYSLATLKENVERKAVLEELLPLTESTRGLQPIRLNTLINLAALSNDTRDHKKAVDYALRAERASDREMDPNGYAFTLANRGVAWVHQGRFDEGLALVRTSIEIAERTGDKRELADLIEQQVDALETAGRTQAALQALRRWVTLNNELTASQREQAVTQLQETYAAQQRAREIETLRLDNARRDTELQLRSWRERAWAAAAVLVALLAFITWQRLARSRSINRGLRSDVARLSDESQHDAMTGACNRRYGEALLQRLQEDNAKLPEGRRRRVSLMLLDVDHFKRVNDTHGHAAGDAVLVEMTQRLQAMLRDGDAVVRWGGEEFLLILPGTDGAGLQVVAERALAVIGQPAFGLPQGKQLPVRASAGGVVWRAGQGVAWAESLALADAALYQAKADGRNRAVCALSDQPFVEAELAQLGSLAAEGRVELVTVTGVAADAPAATSGVAAATAAAAASPPRDTATA
ncbi:MAG TPA: diguanylate cyclase [Ideonella sp.]|uniref:diguanylate cyclase domain-containing protein n=1 Tax=Ideonella sp. TaxID=1929293 RepID=UPI002E367AB6|nr:diguanylate cyclase [Ideonella sp.]HEX5687108.1 diguanylate cyclase [Ideonella sp.]